MVTNSRFTIRRAGDSHASFCPTPEEIRLACREIQANWSERERARRFLGLMPGQTQGDLSESVDLPQCVDPAEA